MDEATLKRQRGVVKASITRDHNYATTINKDLETVFVLKNKRTLADQHFKRFDELQTMLEEMSSDAELPQYIADREDAETKYLEVISLIDAVLAEKETPQQQPTFNSTNTSSQARLPKLNIPTFTGDYTTWTSFHDLFTAMVHNHTGLSGAQKLQFLKQSLQGEAAGLLRSMTVTDKNYDEAWKMLTDRYDNKRQIITSHLKTLFSVNRVTEESASALRTILDCSTESLRSLKAMNRTTDHWDDLVVYFLAEKLDQKTREKWESYTITSDFPTIMEFTSFMEERCRILDAIQTTTTGSRKEQGHQQRKIHTHTVTTDIPCAHCKGQHTIYKCFQYNGLSPKARSDSAETNGLCFNCLRPGHGKRECKSGACRKCQGKHHTLLHIERRGISSYPAQKQPKQPIPGTSSHTQGSQPSTSAITSTTATTSNTVSYVLLSTATIHVKDACGNPQECRALLDSGSQASFITESCLQRLQLKKKNTRIPLNGVAATGAGSTTGSLCLHISSPHGNYSTTIDAFVLPKITCQLPSRQVDCNKWAHLQSLQLADQDYNRPGHIDILLGADVFAELLLPNRIIGINGAPFAQDTVFGWILSGKINTTSSLSSLHITTLMCSIEEDKQLTRFWETENLPQELGPLLTPEELKCEESFISTYRRDATSGRFIVRFPWKEDTINLGDSRQRAYQRLRQMENKYHHNPEHWKEYVAFMNEYLSLGHMGKINPGDVSTTPVNYLPHHMVLKESSTSTKYRVVFDASAKTSNGQSLNDNLLVGARQQEELVNILTRFRKHKIAFTADIQKMYRQILVDKSEADYQRILWRESPADPVSEYRLLTVTYGVRSSPFSAIRVIRELAKQNQDTYPNAARVAEQDFYVDDVISGEEDESAAMTLQTELIQMLHSAGFPLRKWSSNSQLLLQNLPEDHRETKIPFQFEDADAIKTLGVVWNPTTDAFSYNVKPTTTTTGVTKRSLLSDTARLFDPVGWIAPVIITAKMMFQQLWLLGVGWDDPLPPEITTNYNKFKSELPQLNNVRIPRHVGQINHKTQLHGFSDASERGYGAVIYARTIDNNNVKVSLITAKTRVAPVQQISLPRLELCGALLLSKLMKTVMKSFNLQREVVTLWTDSEVVLCWLQQHPIKWKNYVANRVSAIQDEFPAQHWRHVPGASNPADVASRGVNASELLDHPLWWTGPTWLSEEDRSFPHQAAVVSNNTALKECRKEKIASHPLVIPADHIIYAYSSFTTLVRVVSWILRFKHNCLKAQRVHGPLTTVELQTARFTVIKIVQASCFPNEVEQIQQKVPISKKSTLIKLNPFLDDGGVLRVGGRLRNSLVNYNRKHPIILPTKHHITDLLITTAHLSTLHGGSQIVQATLQQEYWIPCARSKIRQHIHKCISCFKHKPASAQQLMGDLPSSRVQPIHPFFRTGVDYAGPILYKMNGGRGCKSRKGYIAVFVCMATKAVHLKFVTDLTTTAFLAALERMVSRRGLCKELVSDKGSNFRGAKRELNELQKLLSSQSFNEEVQRRVSDNGIQWSLAPSGSPHFGGLYESAVKSTKHHLKRTAEGALMTFEEMTTLLCKIEAVLNSRPLLPLTSDPDDVEVLTPSHFLIGHPMNAVPNPDLTDVKLNRLSRWQLIERQLQQFWKRWQHEYLVSLQQRHKWTDARPNLKEGDLVLIRDERLPPCHWERGRIRQVIFGRDGHVRVAKVKTANSELLRSIVKLCPFPCLDD